MIYPINFNTGSILLFITFIILTACSGKESEKSSQKVVVKSYDGNVINYHEQGTGEMAIIFVHGWAGDLTNWENQLADSKPGLKLLALDLVGFGQSEGNRADWSMEQFAWDIRSVIKQSNIKKAILVGHSMGAFAIVETALMIPDIVIGIVPVDVFHDPAEITTNEEIEKRITRTLSYVSESGDSIREGWEESLRSALHWKNHRFKEILPKIEVPIICINSDRYHIKYDIALQYNPKMKYKVVSGTGHAVMLEAPDEFNRELTEAILEIEDFAKQIY